MWDFLAQHWKDLLELAGVFGGLYKYFKSRESELQTRREELATRNGELAWRRAQTLMALGQQFAGDPDVALATRLIEDRLDDEHIDQLYDDRGEPYDELHGLRLWQVDKYLDFLERIVHAYRALETLSLAEVAIFGGYFQQVRFNERLRLYCLDHGYAAVVEVAAEIDALPQGYRPGGARRA